MIEQDTKKTRVVFRKWRSDKEIIALFPDISADDRGHCSSFMHIGQHGGADYQGVIGRTVLAKPHEYEELEKELIGRGYLLKIIRRKN